MVQLNSYAFSDQKGGDKPLHVKEKRNICCHFAGGPRPPVLIDSQTVKGILHDDSQISMFFYNFIP